MKKNRITSAIASAAAVAVMCAALPVMNLSAAQPGSGDLDKDGQTGVTDIVMLTKYLHGTQQLGRTATTNADMTGDGTIDVFDLSVMKRTVLNGSGQQPEQPTETPTETPSETPTETPTETPSETPTEAPTDPVVIDPNATGVVAEIIFNGASVTLKDAEGAEIAAADASNVAVSGAYVTIVKSGSYAISGASTDGQIKVNTDNTAEPEAQVELSFQGLELSNSKVAPVYVENVGDECVISVKKETTNIISDGTSHTDSYTTSEGETKTVTSAIFARDDLKIKGKGTLTVNGNTEDGIVSANDVKIFNSTLIVNAADDGIRGDTVKIGDADDAVSVCDYLIANHMSLRQQGEPVHNIGKGNQMQGDENRAQTEGVDQKTALGLSVLGEQEGPPEMLAPFLPLLLSCPAPVFPLQVSDMPVQILVVAHSV